jgi:hypothetical protein
VALLNFYSKYIYLFVFNLETNIRNAEMPNYITILLIKIPFTNRICKDKIFRV